MLHHVVHSHALHQCNALISIFHRCLVILAESVEQILVLEVVVVHNCIQRIEQDVMKDS